MNEINLIILPGWGGSHETWRNFVAAVGMNFDNITVIDLPCFGDSPCPTEVWGVDDYVDYVKKEIIKLNYKGKVVLLGHSFGGQVAASLVVSDVDVVDALILSGAAIIRPKYIIKRFVLGIVAKTGKLIFKLPMIEKLDIFAKKFLYKIIRSKNYADSNGIKRKIFMKVIRENKEHLLPQIKIPTLILWGQKDSFVPLKYGKKIHRSIPGASMYIVKNGSHGLHIKNILEIELVINEFISHV